MIRSIIGLTFAYTISTSHADLQETTIPDLTLANYSELINPEIPLIVDVYATWCEPCKKLEPHLESLEERYGDKLTIVKVDREDSEYETIMGQLGAEITEGLPVLILKNNDKILNVPGYREEARLTAIVQEYFNLP
jgi:thioredoxin 1